MDRIALVGAGLIGQAWAIVFGRAGHAVLLYDAEPAMLEQARRNIAARLEDLATLGLVEDAEAALGRVGYAATLGQALASADYVQESTPERVDVHFGDDGVVWGERASEFEVVSSETKHS